MLKIWRNPKTTYFFLDQVYDHEEKKRVVGNIISYTKRYNNLITATPFDYFFEFADQVLHYIPIDSSNKYIKELDAEINHLQRFMGDDFICLISANPEESSKILEIYDPFGPMEYTHYVFPISNQIKMGMKIEELTKLSKIYFKSGFREDYNWQIFTSTYSQKQLEQIATKLNKVSSRTCDSITLTP